MPLSLMEHFFSVKPSVFFLPIECGITDESYADGRIPSRI
jgi:hypothetical protein